MVAMSAGSASAESPAAIPQCNVNSLSLSLGGEEGAASHILRTLLFTNVSGSSCSMQGWPGVSFVAGDDGHQVGPAAERFGTSNGPVILAPGGVASVLTDSRSPDVYDPNVCQPTDVRGFRVYAPNDTLALFVPLPAGSRACAAIQDLSVYPVQAGSGN